MRCPKGKIKKEGRCVTNKSSRKSRKVSYNPFKMYGSYIGLIIGGIYGYLALKNYWFDIFDILIKLGMQNKAIGQGIINYPVAIILQGAIGFLIGWGVNSLVRYWRNRW